MEDLESMSGEASQAGVTVPDDVAGQKPPLEMVTTSRDWSLVSYQKTELALSSPKAQEDNFCISLIPLKLP